MRVRHHYLISCLVPKQGPEVRELEWLEVETEIRESLKQQVFGLTGLQGKEKWKKRMTSSCDGKEHSSYS